MVNEIESSRKIKEADMNINSWQSVGLCLRERERVEVSKLCKPRFM